MNKLVTIAETDIKSAYKAVQHEAGVLGTLVTTAAAQLSTPTAQLVEKAVTGLLPPGISSIADISLSVLAAVAKPIADYRLAQQQAAPGSTPAPAPPIMGLLSPAMVADIEASLSTIEAKLGIKL